MHPKVLLETNVLKFAATKIPRLIPVNKETRNSQGEVTGFLLYEPGYINPNDKIPDSAPLKAETELLPRIADLAKKGEIELFLHKESMFEGWGLKNMNSATGRFYNAPMTDAKAPIEYGRVLFRPGMKADDWAKQFFLGIQDKRYVALAKIAGAYQGKNGWNLNQLRDAFYVWCAEHNGCDYMLTLDFNLIKAIERDKKHNVKVKVVKASQLLAQLVFTLKKARSSRT